MVLFELLSDMLFEGKSFKQWYMGDSDDVFEATALFIINYVLPLGVAAGTIWLIVAAYKSDMEKDKQKHQQSVPVNKTVMWNPKQIDKKTTIKYNDVKKLLAQIPGSNKINTK